MKALMLLGALACAQSSDAFRTAPSELETQAKNTIQPLIRITVQWIFPAVALVSALYGVARGIKRGEWDFTVICMVAAIALAMIPTVVARLFGLPTS
jgi:hypothetical protein